MKEYACDGRSDLAAERGGVPCVYDAVRHGVGPIALSMAICMSCHTYGAEVAACTRLKAEVRCIRESSAN